MTENKYSYQDCWNYALSLRKDIATREVKNDTITLCQTVPEKFWLEFSSKLLSSFDYSQICHSLNKHLKGDYPVPYLTNKVFFYGLSFYVEKGVFIPQPDTEVLVEKTLEVADKYWKKEEKLKVLDIGTGCGSIVISLAKSRPDWDFMAVDINEKALKIAKINAANYHKKNIKFSQSDLFNNINVDEKFAIVVANPPYVNDTEYENLLSSAKAQPKEALVAACDGYFFYQEIFQKVGNFLAKKFLLMVEISPSQEEKVIKLVIDNFPKVQVSIFPDWEGRSRVIAIKKWVI